MALTWFFHFPTATWFSHVVPTKGRISYGSQKRLTILNFESPIDLADLLVCVDGVSAFVSRRGGHLNVKLKLYRGETYGGPGAVQGACLK